MLARITVVGPPASGKTNYAAQLAPGIGDVLSLDAARFSVGGQASMVFAERAFVRGGARAYAEVTNYLDVRYLGKWSKPPVGVIDTGGVSVLSDRLMRKLVESSEEVHLVLPKSHPEWVTRLSERYRHEEEWAHSGGPDLDREVLNRFRQLAELGLPKINVVYR